MDLINTIKKPFADYKTLIIGIVISLIPIVSILNMGYIMKVIRERKKLPEYTFNSDLIMDSLKALVFGIIWAFIIAIIFAILTLFFGGSVLSGLDFSDPATVMTSIAGSIATIIAAGIIFIIVGIILVLIVFAGFLNFVKKNSLKAGFAIGDIIKIAFSGKFIIAFVIAMILAFVIQFIWGYILTLLAVLMTNPILAAILLGLLNFPIMVIMWDIIADSA